MAVAVGHFFVVVRHFSIHDVRVATRVCSAVAHLRVHQLCAQHNRCGTKRGSIGLGTNVVVVGRYVAKSVGANQHTVGGRTIAIQTSYTKECYQ